MNIFGIIKLNIELERLTLIFERDSYLIRKKLKRKDFNSLPRLINNQKATIKAIKKVLIIRDNYKKKLSEIFQLSILYNNQ